MIFRQRRRADGAGDPRHPQQRETGIEPVPNSLRDQPCRPPQRPGCRGKAEQHHQPQLHLQAVAAGDTRQEHRPFPRHHQHQPVKDLLAAQQAEEPRRLVRLRQPPGKQEIEQRPQHQRGDAHLERRVEAVPQRQAVVGRGPAQHRQHTRLQDGADQRLGPESDHQHDGDKELDRAAHPGRGLVGFLGQVGRQRTKEHRRDEAQRIGDAEHAGKGGDIGQPAVQPGAVVPVGGLGKEHFLGQEPVEQRHPRHGGGGDDGQQRGARHGVAQPGKLAQVAGAGFMVDDPRAHEQRGLEHRVVHDVEDRGDDGRAAAHAGQRGDQPQVADGGIGQQPFQVVAPGRDHRADDQRHHAGPGHDPEPRIRRPQHRREPHQQEHPRLYHGGRMQIGADRRRRGHGVGQPEMERELRRFCKRTQQEQPQDPQIPRVRPHQIARAQHVIQLIAADRLSQQHHRRQQRDTPRRGDHQRGPRPVAGAGVLVPVADQQERKQAGQFPEHHHQDDVAGDQHPHHRPGKGQQKPVEPRHRIRGRQIIARIDHHQQPDPVDQQQHQPGKPVQPQRDVQPQRGRPAQRAGYDLPGGDIPEQRGQRQQPRNHDRAGQRDLGVAGRNRHGNGRNRPQKGQHGKQQEQVLGQHTSGLSPFVVMAARRARGSRSATGAVGGRVRPAIPECGTVANG